MLPIANNNCDCYDPYFRYQMPAVIVKHEKGKTVFENLLEIASSLKRKPELILKFVGQQIGAGTFRKNQKFLINGCHTAKSLQTVVHLLVTKLVLCYTCGNPDTNLSVSKGKKMFLSCSCCGNVETIVNVKLHNYV
jgi:translation initiation factor 5